MANTIDNLLDQLDADVLMREAALERALKTSYDAIWARLSGDLEALQAKVDQARAVGQLITPAWLRQEQRLLDLVSQAEAQVGQVATDAEPLISDAQRAAALAADDHTTALMAAGIGPPAGVGLTFNRLPVEAIGQLVGHAYDGSPLSALLGQLGPEVGQAALDVLVTGLATGDGPRQIARVLRDVLDTASSKALTIARTETLNAYRGAALANYRANSDVVKEWEWHADPKACDECKAKHGRRYPLHTPFEEHPNGRCAPIPVTRTWAELGIPVGLSSAGFALQEIVIIGPYAFAAGGWG